MVFKKCVKCGSLFEAGSNRALYCNDCKNKLNKPKSKSCLICGEKFIPKHASTKYCSDNCKLIAKSEYDRNYFRNKAINNSIIDLIFFEDNHDKNDIDSLKSSICRNCGKIFISSNDNQLYCSLNCVKDYLNKKNIKNSFKDINSNNKIYSFKEVYNKSFLFDKVKNYLKSINLNFECNYDKFKWFIDSNYNNMVLDFYIPNKNVAIMVNDTLNNNSTISNDNILPKEVNYQYNKSILCKNHDIQLIHIFDKDIDQLESLLHVLKHHKQYPNGVLYYKHDVFVKDFIKKYHRQHTCTVNYGGALCHPKTHEIIAAITFKKYKDTIHLDKLCYKTGIIVHKGLSTLMNNYISNESYKFPKNKKIVSFCDLTFNNGIGYEKAGFKVVSYNPNFFWTNGNKWLWRRTCQINNICKMFNLNRNDFSIKNGNIADQMMTKLGYVKVYDAGMNKYEFII
jgi:hypothetical protein